MKRFLLLPLLLVLLVPVGTWATEYGYDWFLPVPSGLTTGDLMIATNGHTLVNVSGMPTDGHVFLNAVDNCVIASNWTSKYESGSAAQFIASRIASGSWALARGAPATEEYYGRCSLNSWLQRYGSKKGIKLTSVEMVFFVGGLGTQNTPKYKGLASHYWGGLATAGYSNNAEPTIGSDLAIKPTLLSGAVSFPGWLATAQQASPYVTTVTVLTANQQYLPYLQDVDIFLEWNVTINPGISYRFYGVGVNFTRRDH